MVMAGRVLPSVVITSSTLELKSPVTCTRVVRGAPLPNVQVETEDHDPSPFRVAALAEQFFRRSCELNTESFAADSSLTQDWVRYGLPIIVMVVSHSPGFWRGTGAFAHAIVAAETPTTANAKTNENLITCNP
jgi:hypothetical protein